MTPEHLASVAILCGGRGTRLQQGEAPIPKPLVEIGGKPIVWHVIELYAQQGVRDILLLTGYKAEHMEAFAAAQHWPEGVTVTCIDTGLETPTGGRVHRVRDRLAKSGRPFAVTYADGVADLDLDALAAFHGDHGCAATVTVVRPELQFGVVDLDSDGRVTGFREKPRAEHWINGGFFIFEPHALDVLKADSVLEREPLERLAAAGELRAHRHDGFWACMDTYKDALRLNDLWDSGDPPWLLKSEVR